MANSEKVIADVKRHYNGHPPACVSTLIDEYKIIIKQALAAETSIHMLCKLIEELPGNN